ncbi:MAG TPA: hypothetical protein VK530_04855, partial [Candidatus Acidoferrum sp.]|nr:hypothetical protein [Candidatus Acidoferrum sp.]
ISVRRVNDGAVLHASYLEYRGAEQKFTTWAADDAHSFRAEIGFAEREFGRAILQQYMTPPGEGGR